MSENYAKGQLLIEALKLLQVGIWGIKEVNLNTGCPHIQHDIKSLFKTNDQEVKIQISTSPEILSTKYKPGGILIRITSKLVGRVQKMDQIT